MAMSATRVMATCATMGQAVGTAAAIAHARGTTARGVYQHHLLELQRALFEDDQYLPGRQRPLPTASTTATLAVSHGDGSALHDGIDRRLGDDTHWFELPLGGWLEQRFPAPTTLGRLRLIGDSQLHRSKRMPCSWPQKGHDQAGPPGLARDLVVEVEHRPGTWETVTTVRNNRRRLLSIPLPGAGLAVRVTITATWGDDNATLFACDVGVCEPTGEITVTAWPAQAVTAHARA